MVQEETSAIQPAPDLLTKLSQLETQVATMQQHLAALAPELLQERTQRDALRLQTLESLRPLSAKTPKRYDVPHNCTMCVHSAPLMMFEPLAQN
jgi:hypothetical protein